jgi:DNA polymerase
MGINPYSKTWSKLTLIPGRITENVIQSLARDVMGHGLKMVDQNMQNVGLIGTVHDEALGLIWEDHATPETLETFNKWLCHTEPWAEGLPLKAEGYIAKRYRK